MDSTKKLTFYKYQGTGNDFVLIDNRMGIFPKENTQLVNSLCDRRFGIGADGLILLEDDDQLDFNMVYYNADGNQSSMCGNGGRCIVAFAKKLDIITDKAVFNAVDGVHHASVQDNQVTLEMIDVDTIRQTDKFQYLNTGSPHHVQLVTDIEDLDVDKEGAKIRYGMYGEEGSNINFVRKLEEDTFKVRTYERGVEGETLSCGTGVTAVALAMHNAKLANGSSIGIATSGGELNVSFDYTDGRYSKIQLTGPAIFVFKGEIAW